MISGVTVARGCCKVEAGSPVCPTGGDYQVTEYHNPEYTIYLTRCEGDLCNSDDGKSGGIDTAGVHGNLIVDGVPGGGDSIAKSGNKTLLLFAAAFVLILLAP